MTMDQPGWNPPEKKKSGVLKWILFGCGGLLILIAAGAGVIGYIAYRSVNTDSIEVQTVAQEILPLETPEGFKGRFSMNMMGMKMASLTNGPASIVLMSTASGGANQEEMRKRMLDNLSRRGEALPEVERQTTETFRVRGKDVEAQVGSGSRRGDPNFIRYSFLLGGKDGRPAMLMISGPDKQITHDWVQTLLNSVR